MSIQNLNELLDKYDKLRSVANSGSSDKSIILKFKFFKPVFENKLLKKFSINTYVVPFALKPIRKEIRSSLIYILRLYEINHLRIERSDKSSKEAMDAIKKYLEEIPKHSLSFEDNSLKKNFWNIFASVAGILPIIVSFFSTAPKTILIIIGIIVLLVSSPFIAFDLSMRIMRYSVERSWYKDWMKRLAIKDLKDKIVNELVQLNDQTYTELDTKYK